MNDWWIAECIPCRWETRHHEQDVAISAAEQHVRNQHADVPPHIRGPQKIGHVQNRTVDDEQSSSPTSTRPESSGTALADDSQAGTSSAAAGEPLEATTPAPVVVTQAPQE